MSCVCVCVCVRIVCVCVCVYVCVCFESRTLIRAAAIYAIYFIFIAIRAIFLSYRDTNVHRNRRSSTG